MTFLVENLPQKVARATIDLGLVRSGKDRVPKRLAELLTLPLFDLDEVIVRDAAIIPDEAVIQAVDFAEFDQQEPKPQWTLDGVFKLHSILLEESLRALAARGNGEQKREILEWLFEPDFVGTVYRHGRDVPVFTRQCPWSFVFCCRLEGMDAEAIREQIRQKMPAQARQFFH